MLYKKIEYNNKYFSMFRSDPYEAKDMKDVIQKIQAIEEIAQQAPFLVQLSKNVNKNSAIEKIFEAFTQICSRIDDIIRKKVFTPTILKNLMQLSNCTLTHRLQDIQSLSTVISKFQSCLDLVKKDHINSYIKSSIQTTIRNAKNIPIKGFHIVMSSFPYSQTYFLNIFQVIKELKVQMSSFKGINKDIQYGQIPITSITSSNIYSISSILYASDLSYEKIVQYCYQIKDLTYESQKGFIQRIQAGLKKKDWLKEIPVLLKDLTALCIRQAQDSNIFLEAEKRLNTNELESWDDFVKQIKALQISSQEMRQRIGDLIHDSLNCVMDEVYQVGKKSLKDNQKFEQVAKFLSLRYKDKNYAESIEPLTVLADKIKLKLYMCLKIIKFPKRFTKVIKIKSRPTQSLILLVLQIILKFQNNLRRIDKKNMINVQSMGVKDIFQLYNLGLGLFDIFRIPFIKKGTQMIGLYINSHDHLVRNLYKSQIIMLPSRLGTLDFHLMCHGSGKNSKFSSLSNDTIMQSYFAMLQKARFQQALKSKGRVSKFMYFRLESNNSQNKGLVVRFLSKKVPNQSLNEVYKISYKQNEKTKHDEISDEYVYLQDANFLFLKIQFVDLKINESTCVRSKKVEKFFKLDISAFKALVADRSQFGYVYCLEYTKNFSLQRLLPQSGVNGEFNRDYMITDKNRSIRAESLAIKAFLIDDHSALKYETPLCDQYHILTHIPQPNSVLFYGKRVNCKVPRYKCLTCKANKKEKYKYTIAEKYQIVLSKQSAIKCTFDHPLTLNRSLIGYPSSLCFSRCDRCYEISPLGYFKDKECEVDICFSCAFELINDQL